MNKPLAAGLIILGAIIGSGITYYAVNVRFESVRADFSRQIESLSQQIVQNDQQNKQEIATLKTAQQKAAAPQPTAYQKATSDFATKYPSQRGEVLTMTSPKGGEVMCLNHEFEIKWSGSPKIQIVSLYLIDPKNSGEYIAIDSVPFSHGGVEGGATGSYIWTVGKLRQDPYSAAQSFIAPGDAYRIQLSATYPVTTNEGLVVYDLNDKPLSIADCR